MISRREFMFIFLLSLSTQLTMGQVNDITDTGYLIRKAFDTAQIMTIFVHSNSVFTDGVEPKSIVSSLSQNLKTGIALLSYTSELRLQIQNFYKNVSIRLRNESQEFRMTGFYEKIIEKYKDDYFHISVLPVIVKFSKLADLQSTSHNRNSRLPYEIKCLGRVIMSEYEIPNDTILTEVMLVPREKH